MKKTISTPTLIAAIVVAVFIAGFLLLRGVGERDPSSVLPGDYSKDPTTERMKIEATRKAEAAKSAKP